MQHLDCIDAAERLDRDRARATLAQALGALWEAPAAIGVLAWYGMLVWQRRADMRRALARLDERELADMGISRAWAAREAAKPFWRA